MSDNVIEVQFDLSMLHPAQRLIAQDTHRFRVAACGRRFGKTTGASAESVIVAAQGGRVWYVSPTYSMAGVAWREMKRLARQIPGANIRNTDRVIEMPGGDGEVVVKSAEDVDKLRGEGIDFLVMEEFAFMRKEAWDVLRPSTADRRGRALFISSTWGRNHFWELWNLGMDGNHAEWKSFHFPTSANPHMSADELAEIQRTTPAYIWEREYEAVFDDAAGAVFRNIEASYYRGKEAPIPDRRYVLGCDLAMQNDFSFLTVTDTTTGRVVDMDRFHQQSWAIQRGRIQAMCWRWKVQTAWVEANSIGSPLIEQMQQSGLPVKAFWTTSESKSSAIQALALAFELGEIGLPKDHPLTPTLVSELGAFQASQLESGRWKYAASGSAHDDGVMSLALSWYGFKRRKPIIAVYKRYG